MRRAPLLAPTPTSAATAAIAAAVALLRALPAAAQSSGIVTGAAGELMPDAVRRGMLTGVTREFFGIIAVIVASRLVWGFFLLKLHGGNVDAHHKALATFRGAAVSLGLVIIAGILAPQVVDVVMLATVRA